MCGRTKRAHGRHSAVILWAANPIVLPIGVMLAQPRLWSGLVRLRRTKLPYLGARQGAVSRNDQVVVATGLGIAR